MMMIKTAAVRRRNRARAKLIGSHERPRLTVKITNRHITAQIIDDSRSHTLAYVTTSKQALGSLTDQATWAGQELAKLAKARKITAVVFDRAGRTYQRRLQALATAAREGGLKF